MKSVLLVDAKNLMWRAASVMGELRGREGVPTGAIHGFFTVLTRVVEEFPHGTKVIVCWDCWKKGPSARRKMVETYKRAPKKPDKVREETFRQVTAQQVWLRQILSHLDVKQVRSPGWEADDVMGTLALGLQEKYEPVIFTGDRDLYQCISKKVRLFRPMNDGTIEEVTSKNVEERFGVSVRQFVCFKSLVGDSGDNIDGCPGIGEKTAAKLLGGIDGTVSDLIHLAEQKRDFLKKPLDRWELKLVENKKAILDSKKLALINVKAPLKFLKRKPDPRKAKKLLAKWKMMWLLSRFSKLSRLGWSGRVQT